MGTGAVKGREYIDKTGQASMNPEVPNMAGMLQSPTGRMEQVKTSVKRKTQAFVVLLLLFLMCVVGAILVPSLSTAFAMLGILFAFIALLAGIFAMSDYDGSKRYEKWVELMNKRYGTAWDENRYGFFPFFVHSEEGNKGTALISQKHFYMYENGLATRIVFRWRKKVSDPTFEYYPYSDIESLWLTKGNGGLTTLLIETVDLKVAHAYFFDATELNQVVATIQEKLGHRWLTVFKGEVRPYKDHWEIHTFIQANTTIE